MDRSGVDRRRYLHTQRREPRNPYKTMSTFEIIEQRNGAPLNNGPDSPPHADGFYWSRDFASDCCWGPFKTLSECTDAAESGTLRGDGYGGPLERM